MFESQWDLNWCATFFFVFLFGIWRIKILRRYKVIDILFLFFSVTLNFNRFFIICLCLANLKIKPFLRIISRNNKSEDYSFFIILIFFKCS